MYFVTFTVSDKPKTRFFEFLAKKKTLKTGGEINLKNIGGPEIKMKKCIFFSICMFSSDDMVMTFVDEHLIKLLSVVQNSFKKQYTGGNPIFVTTFSYPHYKNILFVRNIRVTSYLVSRVCTPCTRMGQNNSRTTAPL